MLTVSRKFVGWCAFDDDEPTSIKRAILRRDREIVIEFESGGYSYTVNLRSTDGRIFQGQSVGTNGGEEYTGSVNGTWNETKLVMECRWRDEEGHYQWFVELEEVDKFPDEMERRA